MKRERGNILFLILLAVVLFAALSYAVTGSQREQIKPLTTEVARSQASTVLQYFTLVEQTVGRMVVNGIPVETLDWSGNDISYNGANPACTSNACKVYNKAGGGVSPIPLANVATDQTIDYNPNFKTPANEGLLQTIIISVKNVGTDMADVLLLYKSARKEVCDQLNTMAGIYANGDTTTPVAGWGSDGTGYVSFGGGTYSPWPALTSGQLGNTDSRLIGQRTFCIYRSVSGGYYLYHVVYAR